MIIGATGRNRAGKSTALRILEKRGAKPLSLSDYLRDVVEERYGKGERENRKLLREVGNELREKYGPGYVMEQTLKKITRPLDLYVIDSIRNPGEVLAMRTWKYGSFFFAVDARPDIRYNRVGFDQHRKEEYKTYEEFLLDEQKEEMAQAHGQQLSKTIDMANFVFLNNGTQEEFEWKINDTFDKMPALNNQPLSWDEYFMSIAKLVSQKSSCIKRRVGAVIVRNNQFLSAGYNGTPRGLLNCDQGGCPRCNDFSIPSGDRLNECVCVHAEQNAIIQAAMHGVNIEGGTLYTTTSPCLDCSKMMANARINKIYFCDRYPNQLAETLLAQANIPLDHQHSRY